MDPVSAPLMVSLSIPDPPVVQKQNTGILRLFNFWGSPTSTSTSPVPIPIKPIVSSLLSPSLPSTSFSPSSLPQSLPLSAVTSPTLSVSFKDEGKIIELIPKENLDISPDIPHIEKVNLPDYINSTLLPSSTPSLSSSSAPNNIESNIDTEMKRNIATNSENLKIISSDSIHDGVLLSVSWKKMLSIAPFLVNEMKNRNIQLYGNLHRCITTDVNDGRYASLSYCVSTSSSTISPTSPTIISSISLKEHESLTSIVTPSSSNIPIASSLSSSPSLLPSFSLPFVHELLGIAMLGTIWMCDMDVQLIFKFQIDTILKKISYLI